MDIQLILRTIAMVAGITALILMIINCYGWFIYTRRLLKQLDRTLKISERQQKLIFEQRELIDTLSTIQISQEKIE